MSTGTQIFITIIALIVIIGICWSISDYHDKMRKMGATIRERDIYYADMQYWKNKYWELHKLHYEKDEKEQGMKRGEKKNDSNI